MEPVRPKKHLGQHFLKDKNIASKIAESLKPPPVNLLEIGPGTGILTEQLLLTDIRDFKAVEIDRDSIGYLKLRYPQLNLLEGDFLRMDLNAAFEGNFSIIGNFPYNISSQIFFRVIENRHRIEQVVGMVQKEVAQRIASGPGTKDYGILSVLLQAWFSAEYLFTVPPQVFVPPPKVNSAVIRLTRNQVIRLDCDENRFIQVVKTAFNQRRKTLHNALKPLGDYQGQHAGKRAEQLDVIQFTEITNTLFPF